MEGFAVRRVVHCAVTRCPRTEFNNGLVDLLFVHATGGEHVRSVRGEHGQCGEA